VDVVGSNRRCKPQRRGFAQYASSDHAGGWICGHCADQICGLTCAPLRSRTAAAGRPRSPPGSLPSLAVTRISLPSVLADFPVGPRLLTENPRRKPDASGPLDDHDETMLASLVAEDEIVLTVDELADDVTLADVEQVIVDDGSEGATPVADYNVASVDFD
jgi:hypothetical protein